MEHYDYYKEVRKDVEEFLEGKLGVSSLDDKVTEFLKGNNDNLALDMRDYLSDNNITGKLNGSKTSSSWEAKKNLSQNWDLLKKALDCFEVESFPDSAEIADVIIREYVLSDVVDKVLENKDLLKNAYGITALNFQEKLQEKLQENYEKDDIDIDAIIETVVELKEKMPQKELSAFKELLIENGCKDEKSTEKFLQKLATSKEPLLKKTPKKQISKEPIGQER